MREIKFRVWFKVESRYLSNDEFAFFFDSGGDIGVYKCNMDGDHTIDVTHLVEIEQFIGIKDCDNVDIYEGDIAEDDDHYYSVISWDNDDSMYVASDVGGVADLNFPVKVIGNIHENKELLQC